MSGIKHDSEKPDMSLLSSIAMVKIAEVMTFGKRKYSANNWRGGIVYSRLIAAALRHIFAWLGGESKDPETGLSHLAHASCCLMMLMEFETTRPELDDRYQQQPAQPTPTNGSKRYLDFGDGIWLELLENLDNDDAHVRLPNGSTAEFSWKAVKQVKDVRI